jgi:hypothetical protein
MHDFYVEPEPGEPYEAKTGWTIGAIDVNGCSHKTLRDLILSSTGRVALLLRIREGFGEKRTRYDIIASDEDLV